MENLSFLYAGSDILTGTVAHHSHRGWELLYLTKGAFDITFDTGEFFSCTPGDILIISPHTGHMRRNDPETATFFVVFEAESPGFEPQSIIRTGKDRILERWLSDISELHKSNLSRQCIQMLGAVIERLHYLSPLQQNESGLHPAVIRACRFITENYSRKITTADIAAHAAVSPSHLNLLFNLSFGVTPIQHLCMVRMQSARQLLINPNSRIAEVAEICGFDNIHYFTRVFRKFHGVPPGVFRSDPGRFADTENIRNEN